MATSSLPPIWRFRWRSVWAVIMRNYCVYSHTWALSFVPRFFEPVFYLLGLGLGLGAWIQSQEFGESYIAFVGPGLLAASVMQGSTYETTYTMFVKRSNKLYDAFLGTPTEIQDILLGEVLSAATRGLLYGVGFLFCLGLFTWMGHPILVAPHLIPLVLLAVFLIALFFGSMGTLLNAFIPTIEMFAIYFTMVVTPLFLFSGIFFPLDRVPYGESIAWFTPLYHGVRLTRGLLQGELNATIGCSALWLTLATTAVFSLAIARFRRRILV